MPPRRHETDGPLRLVFWLWDVLIGCVAFCVIVAAGTVGVAFALLLAIPLLIWGYMRYLFWTLFPPPATRDVSRLQGEDGDLDVVNEAVQDEGQPLKQDQHRVIYRDPRLLPKAKPPTDIWPRPKRKKVMAADEANRMFAATMRTRNRNIGDLLPDEAQLGRYDLPVWETEANLAAALDLTVKQLRHFSIHRESERTCHYVTFAIPKRSGNLRVIMAPKQRLKAIQRTLLRQLIDRLPVSPQAHGFRRGRSVRSGAEPHVGQRVVLTMDLKDFFPSVTFGRVRGLLIAYGYGYQVATTLAVLMTESVRQPVEVEGCRLFVPVSPRHCVQGAPTSPGLCNAVALRLDRRLNGLAAKYDWSYTRYADDLAFSGDRIEMLPTIRRLAAVICRSEGFEINPSKTRVQRRGQRQSVTGVVVNDAVGLSRRQRRRIRAMIHRDNQQTAQGKTDTDLRNSIRGQLAYLHMLNAQQAAALQQNFAH